MTEGGFGTGEGFDDEALAAGDTAGGWDVGDEDLELPADLVSLCLTHSKFMSYSKFVLLIVYLCLTVSLCLTHSKFTSYSQ